MSFIPQRVSKFLNMVLNESDFHQKHFNDVAENELKMCKYWWPVTDSNKPIFSLLMINRSQILILDLIMSIEGKLYMFLYHLSL